MSTAWTRRRSALVFSLFFPWFPPLPLSPPEAEPPATTMAASVAGEPQTAAPAPEEPLVLPGVVIEEIPKDSALKKAGLQEGDVILSWERLPNPPANPEAARGELTSYFDWLELKVEQVPRGAVVLRGRRGGEHLELRVEPGQWKAKMRPTLAPGLEEIYLTGDRNLASGNLKAAVQAWSLLANVAESKGGGELRVWGTLLIGRAWEEKGDWGKAFNHFQSAIEIAQSSLAQIAAWEVLGDGHEKRTEYEAAEEAFGSALEIREKSHPDSLGVALTLNTLGTLAYNRRELDRASDFYSKALRIRAQLAPASLELATSLASMGAVAQTRGEVDRAYDYLLQALQIQENIAPQSLGVAVSSNNLGMVAWARGQLERSHDYLQKALHIFEQLSPRSLRVATSLNNLGLVAQDRGELDRAHDYYLRALVIFEELAPESFTAASNLNNLGAVSQDRGELERAHNYFLRALQLFEQLAPQSLDVANCLNNLGTLAKDSGDSDRSLYYFLRAVAIQEKLSPKSLALARSLNNLGVTAQMRGDLAAAHEYYLRALQIRDQLAPQSLDVANSLRNLGAVAQARGDLEGAVAYYNRALQLQIQLAPESLDVAINWNKLGSVARARGDLGRAHGYYSSALGALEHQVSKLGGAYSVQAGFSATYKVFYHDTLDLLLTQGHFPEALHVLERFRAQTFLTMLAERDTVFAADISEELDRERRRLGVLYNRTLKKLAELNTRDNDEKIEATRKELQRLEDEAGDLEARIRKASPRLAALKYPQPLDVERARQTLDTRTLLLSYSVGKERTALFVLSRSGDLEVKILPVGEEALRSQVKQLLSLIREAVQGSPLGALRQHRVQTVSRELYTALLEPVAERIAASDRLLILPDGPLHALPFAALVRGAGADAEGGRGQYLAEWKPLHIALSATVFAELKQRRHPASESNASQAPIQLAAFGDPVYPQSLTKAQGDSAAVGDAPRGDPTVRLAAERGIFDWQPLPYTRREVEGIARLFPAGTARTFLGPEALEDRIKSLDPKTRILHLAAHGYTDEHLPSSSFVALTIPEDTSSDAAGPERDNGLLQVWEIFERVRLDADLVVLSACDTGLGEEQGGEGLIGLTRAFQYAGARTVMASLWSVQDQATSELMIRFYKHLRAGLPKDEALRQAQIELIRDPIEVVDENGEKTLLDVSAPYYWAGFQVYGDWQ